MRRSLFEVISKRGKKLSRGSFTLIVSPEGRSSYSVVIPKKVAPKASARNLLRRRLISILRETFRGKGQAAILLVRKGAEEMPFSELKKEIQALAGDFTRK